MQSMILLDLSVIGVLRITVSNRRWVDFDFIPIDFESVTKSRHMEIYGNVMEAYLIDIIGFELGELREGYIVFRFSGDKYDLDLGSLWN